MYQTLALAQRVRCVLMGIFGRRHNAASPAFSGKDALGNILSGHRHAAYLPADENGDGFIDHLTIFAAMGFGQAETDAMQSLPQEWNANRQPPLSLLAIGPAEQFRDGILAESSDWLPATPFVATRHPKRRGRRRDVADVLKSSQTFLAVNLGEELRRRPNLPAAAIEASVDNRGRFRVATVPVSVARFHRTRRGDCATRLAGAFRLRFSQPVMGPVSLGHASHFGMGLFLPAGVAVRGCMQGGTASC